MKQIFETVSTVTNDGKHIALAKLELKKANIKNDPK